MKMRASLMIALWCAVGCGSKPEPAGGGSADCSTAVENAIGLSKAELKKAIPTIDDAGVAKVKAASLARCTEDSWSVDTRNCMAAAKTRDDVVKCEQRNTPEQRDKLAKAIAAAIGMIDPGSGSGSDSGPGSGSAGSGSAK